MSAGISALDRKISQDASATAGCKTGERTPSMNEFFSWQTLATFAGCAAATAIVTQFLKETFQKLPTQWLSYIIATVILFAATYFTGTLTASSAAIIPLNAILIALASNGAYSAVFRVKNGSPIEKS